MGNLSKQTFYIVLQSTNESGHITALGPKRGVCLPVSVAGETATSPCITVRLLPTAVWLTVLTGWDDVFCRRRLADSLVFSLHWGVEKWYVWQLVFLCKRWHVKTVNVLLRKHYLDGSMSVWSILTKQWHGILVASLGILLQQCNPCCGVSALTPLDGCQEEHPACKNRVMGCWCGYLCAVRCRLYAYRPADATAIPKPHHLLPHLNPD